MNDVARPSTEVAVVPTKREIAVSDDVIPILDTARFEHMQRIASVMATALLIPDSIWKEKELALPPAVVTARCFLIVNQAVRWGLDPFAVAQSTSVIHGKLCYEGKLVQGVIEAKAGVIFTWTYNDKPEGSDDFGIKVTGKFPDGRVEAVDGTVGEWKTTGANSPWGPVKARRRMLHYRGAREWGRFFAPALLLGIYTREEMDQMEEDVRSRRAAEPVQTIGSGIAARLAGPKAGTPAEGFGKEVEGEVGGSGEGKGKTKSDRKDAPVADGSKADTGEGAGGGVQAASAGAGGKATVAGKGDGGTGGAATEKAADPGAELNAAEKALLDKLFAEFVTATKPADVEAVWSAFKEDVEHGSRLLQELAAAKYEKRKKAAVAAVKKKK